MSEFLRDIQSEHDERNLPINKVGVKDITYPVVIMDREGGEQHTVAKVNMFVDLPHNFRGTHMSRFISILNKYRKGISTKQIGHILKEMENQLNAETAHFEIEFDYFVTKHAPQTGEPAILDYHCKLVGDSAEKGYKLEVRVPVTSLCPCSKEISKYGAHNQRSIITLTIKAEEIIWIEDLIRVAETSASCEIYALLKRADEKYVTEYAYENPVFVEDIVRNCAMQLQKMRINWFSVESENMESIHNHSAYAKIEMSLAK